MTTMRLHCSPLNKSPQENLDRERHSRNPIHFWPTVATTKHAARPSRKFVLLKLKKFLLQYVLRQNRTKKAKPLYTCDAAFLNPPNMSNARVPTMQPEPCAAGKN
jgi:hypothetical protein